MNVVLLSLFIAFLSGCLQPASQPAPPPIPVESDKILYFSETGHTVQAPFVGYFEARNEQALLGYPITEALEHNGWLVQFFQNGRLELHPENEPAYRVTVGWVGQLLHYTKSPLPSLGAGRYFAETGHAVQSDFLTFFETHNGTIQFGKPISEPFLCADGLLCQDFQSARLVWNPDLPVGARASLAPLGETYFLASGLPAEYLSPIAPPPGAEIIADAIQLMPADATATLRIEPTADPRVVRAWVRVAQNGAPLADQSPLLVWGETTQHLPPTSPAGETHLLLVLPLPDADVTFTVRHPQTNDTLAATRFALKK